jgi:glucose-1-phosphate adenylyltransferase
LIDVLTGSEKIDFGKEVIPDHFQTKKTHAYIYEGYWQDIGTIKNFYEANLLFTEILPPFNIYDEEWQVFTRPRYLPPAKIRQSNVHNSIISDGVIIEGVTLDHSIAGLRSRIGAGTKIEDSILMGNDYYETLEQLRGNEVIKRPSMGIGRNCNIRKAIIDKNVRIGDNVRIINKQKRTEHKGENFLIKDGIVIIEKNAILETGTVI